MTRESKEFTRRIKKMGKHVDALRPLAATEKQQNILDEIQGGLVALKEAEKHIGAKVGAAG